MPDLRQDLIRKYYFAEAMALYEQYYSPLATSASDESKRAFLNTPNRAEDRPLAWVPLVFHCTDTEGFAGMVESGQINAPVSLTEIPIGELDRMKIRKQGKQQIAIGFPRAYVQEVGFAPVLYLKHLPELQRTMEQYPEAFESMKPFIALNDDVSAFQEIRTRVPLSLNKAVWILTTDRDESRKPLVPNSDRLQEKFGEYSASYWHRTHQMGMLDEWQFLRFMRDEAGKIIRVEFVGEHYWERQYFTEVTHHVQMPAGKSFDLRFQAISASRINFEGPYRFIDVAGRIKQVIREYFPDEQLPYSVIPNL